MSWGRIQTVEDLLWILSIQIHIQTLRPQAAAAVCRYSVTSTFASILGLLSCVATLSLRFWVQCGDWCTPLWGMRIWDSLQVPKEVEEEEEVMVDSSERWFAQANGSNR